VKRRIAGLKTGADGPFGPYSFAMWICLVQTTHRRYNQISAAIRLTAGTTQIKKRYGLEVNNPRLKGPLEIKLPV
jgi:hypothetical protein